jgi:F-type H+-transporting ATPase subunit b
MKKILLILAITATALVAQVEEHQASPEAAAERAEQTENKTWEWINFGILAVGLGYLLGKTLPPFFKSRTDDIQKDIVDAQTTKREAEGRAAEIERRVSALGAEVEAFRTQSKAEMEQEATRIRQETTRLIEKVAHQAELEIATATKNASRELQTHAAKLALDLAEQRIRTRLDASTESGLVDDFVSDLKIERSSN